MKAKNRQAYETLGKMMYIALAAMFCMGLGHRAAFAEIFTSAGEKEAAPSARRDRTPFEIYGQIARTEWKKLKNRGSPLSVMEWELVTNPSASDKSMDKTIVGKVRNNSRQKFSEVKIKFAIYDEKGHEIAIVQRRIYDFRPQKIWTFEIAVTNDVEKAALNGLYIPSREIR